MRKFTYDLKNTTYTDNLLMTSSIGSLTSDNLVLKLPKQRELRLNEIAFFELKEQRVKMLNYFMGLIGFSALGFAFYSEVIYLFFAGLPFVLFALFLKMSRYYVQIVLRNPEKILIKIAKKDILNIKHFSKRVNDSINATAINRDALKPTF